MLHSPEGTDVLALDTGDDIAQVPAAGLHQRLESPDDVRIGRLAVRTFSAPSWRFAKEDVIDNIYEETDMMSSPAFTPTS